MYLRFALLYFSYGFVQECNTRLSPIPAGVPEYGAKNTHAPHSTSLYVPLLVPRTSGVFPLVQSTLLLTVLRKERGKEGLRNLWLVKFITSCSVNILARFQFFMDSFLSVESNKICFMLKVLLVVEIYALDWTSVAGTS